MRLNLHIITVSMLAAAPLRGEEATPAGPPEFAAEEIEFFEKEVRPVLVKHCFDCHSGAKAKVGLQLDHREGWLRGSDYHRIVDLKSPGASRVIRAVNHAGGDVKSMPDKGDKLPNHSVAALEKWISLSLPWPGSTKAPVPSDPAKHWSLQPVRAPGVPADAGHPIDYFIRKKLTEKGMAPAPPADRYTAYRRVHFDLLGLPPKFGELQKFVSDPRPDHEAFAALVDHLLGSPHYGERWARHWMDVARYSDTRGYEAGGRERRFVYSYTYRNWLIQSFNEDLPFDQFLLYQLAAEQLVKWDKPEKRHLAALGFISLSKNGRQELVVDDRLDTTFRGTMALTVGCARCHDHKFDPIPTKEYYGLYGVFANSMETVQPEIGDKPKGPAYQAYLNDLAKERKKVDDFLEPKLAELAKKFPNIANRRIQLIGKLDRADRRKLQDLQRDVDKFIADRKMEPDKALVVKDRAKPFEQAVFIRGNPQRRGEIAPRRFLSAASLGAEPKAFQNGSGRLEMARAIADPKNPLTARVIVNRVWMRHFGEGIVRTVSDFGSMGEKPDHPELLDWLANWFIENGWSIKKLHRLILTSQTWRQSAGHPDAAKNMLADPENRLLWRSFRRRLDFEQMRDGMLDVAKNLDNQLYGRTVKILEPPYSNRRSVYAYIDRQNLAPVFRHFDFSNPQETTGKRPNTTIPMQGLFTLNSRFVTEQAANLSKNSEPSEDRIAFLHHAVYAKDPSQQDRLLADSFLKSFNASGAKLPRQNLSGWSYGWGGVDPETGAISFQLFPHWDGAKKEWRIETRYPVPDSPKRYLRIGPEVQHPGLGSGYAAILRWHAPRNMKISIGGVLTRPEVNKGRSGFLISIVSSKAGILLTKKFPVTQRDMEITLGNKEVAEGEIIHFVVDCDKDTAFDSYQWDPIVFNAGNPGERWKFSVDFAGPETPLNAWEAYAQALLNTNRFLFIQ